jgi:fatty-acyl-CoA synthase
VPLSYASGTSTKPLLGETIDANLTEAVARFGDREALVDVPTKRRWTYAALDVAVGELARGLLARGISRGDRVGIWAPNCAEWFLTQYATRSSSTSTRPTVRTSSSTSCGRRQ